jgi:chemotaxis protein CheD
MKKPASAIEIFLQPGEFYFGDRNTRIRTILGSCVSITMWHPTLLIGGMCHYMLASGKKRRIGKLNGKYGEDAIMMFLEEAIRSGTNPNDYVFKIFGGGSMFPAQDGHWPCQTAPCAEVIDGCRNVACRNSNIGRALLRQHHLNVVAEHLGGTGHRNVIFDVWSGQVWVRQMPILTRAA